MKKLSTLCLLIRLKSFFSKNASMGRMFHTESVSNAKVCVRTTHLVIYLQVDVMTDAVIIGLESFVKVFSFIRNQTTYYVSGTK